MCVIIKQPVGKAFPENYLTNLYHRNKDGVGIFFPDNGRVQVLKIAKINKADEVLDLYRQAPKDRPVAIHLRMRTHGNIDEANTHPYQVLNLEDHGIDLWMAHNGVISGLTETHKGKSDTFHFIENFLRPT